MSEWRERVRENTIAMIKLAIVEIEKGNTDALPSIENRLAAAALLTDDDDLTLIDFATTPLFRFLRSEIRGYPDGREFAKKLSKVFSDILQSYEKRDSDALHKSLLSFASLCRNRRRQTEFIESKQ